jgi:hypothetical protein
LESSDQGLFNGIIYFEFKEKLYEMCSNEGFKSTYFYIITHFKWPSNALALDTKEKYYFDFKFI